MGDFPRFLASFQQNRTSAMKIAKKMSAMKNGTRTLRASRMVDLRQEE
jgi:hypothetical protein